MFPEVRGECDELNNSPQIDLNHKHVPPQLKERSTSVNDLLGASCSIRSRADRHHDLIEGTPQWGGRMFVPKGAQHDHAQQIK